MRTLSKGLVQYTVKSVVASLPVVEDHAGVMVVKRTDYWHGHVRFFTLVARLEQLARLLHFAIDEKRISLEKTDCLIL